MTSGRPLFLVVLIVISISVLTASAFAADQKVQQPSSSQVNRTDPAMFGGNVTDLPASDLYFLKDKPRVSFAGPVEQSRSAVLNDRDCYFMRMYKVKRQERFAAGENGLRGYTTCELASSYQVHSAIAHVQTNEDKDSRIDTPQK